MGGASSGRKLQSQRRGRLLWCSIIRATCASTSTSLPRILLVKTPRPPLVRRMKRRQVPPPQGPSTPRMARVTLNPGPVLPEAAQQAAAGMAAWDDDVGARRRGLLSDDRLETDCVQQSRAWVVVSNRHGLDNRRDPYDYRGHATRIWACRVRFCVHWRQSHRVRATCPTGHALRHHRALHGWIRAAVTPSALNRSALGGISIAVEWVTERARCRCPRRLLQTQNE